MIHLEKKRERGYLYIYIYIYTYICIYIYIYIASLLFRPTQFVIAVPQPVGNGEHSLQYKYLVINWYKRTNPRGHARLLPDNLLTG